MGMRAVVRLCAPRTWSRVAACCRPVTLVQPRAARQLRRAE